MTCQFNLIDAPWIKVRAPDGSVRAVGIRDALLDAPNLLRIEESSPLVLAALHRLLLAVLHRVLDGPRSVAETAGFMESGRFPRERIEAYLSKWNDRFDLFHPKTPFMQVPDFVQPTGDRSSVSRLAPELASGHNKTLFDHSVDLYDLAIPPDQVARWLVGAQGFALGGGKSSFNYLSHAPTATCAVVLPLGGTLHNTLCLNLVPRSAAEALADSALWERTPLLAQDMAGESARVPSGLADMYAWQSRSVRLYQGEDGGPMVTAVSVASGVKALPATPGEIQWPNDPHVAYRVDDKLGVLPLSIRLERGFWRDFSALAPSGQRKNLRPPRVVESAYAVLRVLDRDNEPVPVMVLGQVNDKAKVLTWRTETFPLPHTLFQAHAEQYRETLEACIRLADEAGRKVWAVGRVLAEGLMSHGGDRKPLGTDVGAFAASLPLERWYWSGLEREFPGLLGALDRATDDGSEAATRWKNQIRATAREALRATARGLGGRSDVLKAVCKAERTLEDGLWVVLGAVAPSGGPQTEGST